MVALASGSKAPGFTLSTMDGKQLSLNDALSRGPVVLAFFKVSCPVCQYAFPFLERIFKSAGSKVSVLGVSQNDKKDTAAFNKEFGITFPVLLDDTSAYPVSNAYGLTNVPTIFWIEPDGTIEVSSVGWVKQDIEDIHRKVSELGAQDVKSLFRPDEQVPAYRPG